MTDREIEIRIDWFRILSQLKENGFSLYQVSDSTAIPKSTLIGYKDGAEPRHADGERLRALWSKATGKSIIDSPRVADANSRVSDQQIVGKPT